MSEHKFNPDYAVPPGWTLWDWMLENDWTTGDVATAMTVTETWVCRFMCGEAKLSEGMASRLATITGIDAKFWLAREKGYREQLKKLDAGSLPAVPARVCWHPAKTTSNAKVAQDSPANSWPVLRG